MAGMKIGDKVIYERQVYIIEKEYGNNVFFIGNGKAFVDLVSANMLANLEEEKQALIDLIIWYRDEYHKKDFCHTEMIDKIRQIVDAQELDQYWQIVDAWLD